MAKLFIFSDSHGYCDILKNALNDAGYDPSNPNHYLIGLGDYFDRGKQPKEMMKFLMNTPRTILIKGNHEDLFEDMCDRNIPLYHDVANGTFETAQLLTEHKDPSFFYAKDIVTPFFNKMINFYETENYIFVHSFIPVHHANITDYWKSPMNYKFNPDWRQAHYSEWKEARWGNPFQQAMNIAKQTGKIIVFGHWHTSFMRWEDGDGENDLRNFDIYYGNNFIGIDGCVHYTQRQNILVLEDNLIEEYI